MKPNYILCDDDTWIDLLPLTFTRPVSELRIGILTIREKWEAMLGATCSYLTKAYLREKFPVHTAEENILINASVLPDEQLIKAIGQLKNNCALVKDQRIIAAFIAGSSVADNVSRQLEKTTLINYAEDILHIAFPWDIFHLNGEALQRDFALLTKGRKSYKLSKTNNLLGEKNIFVEEGVKAEYVTINATTGPVYLSKGSEIMEGAIIRGPLALGDNAVIKLGAKIYGPSTFGPNVKVGGEVNNSVIIANSNKAHDGFLGNAVLGEWCNLGADTNNSNLKNNYAEVKMWNYRKENFLNTGLQFCGLIMGDYSKCGINTMFNTGTVVGVSANIFGSGFPRIFIPSFSWGGAHGFEVFAIKKVFEVAQRVMSRRKMQFSDTEKKILEYIFEYTGKYRNFA